MAANVADDDPKMILIQGEQIEKVSTGIGCGF
jgi:hypothetical protein